MPRLARPTALVAATVLILAACTSGAAAPSAAPSVAPSAAAASQTQSSTAPSVAPSVAVSVAPSIDPSSLLGKIVAAGKIRIATDPNYKPFSFLNPDGTYDGFDNGTAVEAVKRLSALVGKNIAIEWTTPSWDSITAGSWGGRWDISIGSMSVTNGRAKVVDFVDPYYFDAGAVAVPKDSTAQTLDDLNGGKTFCVGSSTTYEQWLQGTLDITDPNALKPPTNPDVKPLDTDNLCVQAVQSGRKYDALVANDNSLADAVRSGAPIRLLQIPPIFTVKVAFALDKSGPNDASLIQALNQVVASMHADGTLTTLSMKYLKKDVTKQPGS
jgi:polar amino acid transport system substrate-binding protein